MGGLPANGIPCFTERQLSKRQPYNRCVGLRLDLPQAASFLVRYIVRIMIVRIQDDILSVGEVAAIFCKVVTAHCENKDNNLSQYGVKISGKVVVVVVVFFFSFFAVYPTATFHNYLPAFLDVCMAHNVFLNSITGYSHLSQATKCCMKTY